MKAEIGNVIENSSGMHVITQVINGVVSDTERLEDFIARNALVEVGGEWVAIHDVIQTRCRMYLKSGIKVIKE